MWCCPAGTDIPAAAGRNALPLFPALDTFVQLTVLTDATGDATIPVALVLSATVRVLEAVAGMLEPILLAHTKTDHHRSKQPELLDTIGVILYHVLATSLPLLLNPAASPTRLNRKATAAPPRQQQCPPGQPKLETSGIDTLIERLTTLIMFPLIHSFGRLSESFTQRALTPGLVGPSVVANGTYEKGCQDGRLGALSLFRVVYCVVEGATETGSGIEGRGIVCDWRAALALEAIRELERVVALMSVSVSNFGMGENQGQDHGPPEAGQGKVSASRLRGDERARAGMEGRVRLAMKDTLWYLCTVLHVLFGGPSGGGDGGSELLREGVLSGLLRLVAQCKYTRGPRSRDDGDECERRGERSAGRGGQGTQEAFVEGTVDATGKAQEHEEGTLVVGVSAGGGSEESGRSVHGPQVPQAGRKGGVGEVEYGMVLGVLERYWVWCD